MKTSGNEHFAVLGRSSNLFFRIPEGKLALKNRGVTFYDNDFQLYQNYNHFKGQSRIFASSVSGSVTS